MSETGDNEQIQWVRCDAFFHKAQSLTILIFSVLRKSVTTSKNASTMSWMTIDCIAAQIPHFLHPQLPNQKLVRRKPRQRQERVSEGKRRISKTRKMVMKKILPSIIKSRRQLKAIALLDERGNALPLP